MDTNAVPPQSPNASAPQKFVRTFAGDMAAVKSGAEPDLAPLRPSESAPAPAPAPDANPLPAASGESVPLPTGHILPPMPSAPLSVPFGRVEAPIIEPPPRAPVAPPPPKPVPPPPIRASQLETYAGDFSKRMKENSASAATVLAAEQDSRGAPVIAREEPPAKGNAVYIVAGVVLLLIGAAGAYYAYARYAASTAPIFMPTAATAPIFVEEQAQISGTGTTLLRAIEQSMTHPPAAGAIRFLYTPVSTTTDNSVFAALQLPAPDALLRNTNAAGSMAGIVNPSGTPSPFFIVSVSSYAETFAALLAWEPKMPRDLAALFPSAASVAAAATTTASTTAPAAKPAAPGFRDIVIANHDTRAYQDATGNIAIVYGYWDPYTLIIARDAAAFSEIIDRLATARKH